MKRKMWNRIAAIGITFGMLITCMSVQAFDDEIIVEDDSYIVVEAETETMFVPESDDVDEGDFDESFISEEGEPEIGDELTPGITSEETEEELQAASTCTGNLGDNVSWSLDLESGLLTINGTGSMRDYGNSKEHALGRSPLYSYRSYIKAVVINEGVTNIGDYVFYYCSMLESVEIPSSVSTIGQGAFCNCGKLDNITIPDTVTSIRAYAFQLCGSLTNISLSKGMKTIGYGLFTSCSKLSSVIIPNSVTSISTLAFDRCISLENIIIPESVSWIDRGAFTSCSSLQSIVIPYKVTSIQARVFEDCTSLSSITIHENVTSIKAKAFNGCTSLTSITIPESVTTISSDAFINCDNLTIYGYSGSYAETYALETNIPFVALVDQVLLDANGGAFSDGSTKKSFSKRTSGFVLPTPKRSGYRFVNWYTKKVNGKEITKDNIGGSSATVLYARWREKSFEVDMGMLPEQRSRIGVHSPAHIPAYFDPQYFENSKTSFQGGLAMLSAIAAETTYDDSRKMTLSFLDKMKFKKTKRGFSANRGETSHSTSDEVNKNDHGYIYLGTRDMIEKNGKEYCLVAVIISGYSKGGYEWVSNFNVGENQPLYHKGFKRAADEIIEWVKDYSPEGKTVKYWITGHSRGGALTNLVAKELTDSTESDVYAYGFATPRYLNTRSPEYIGNISNYNNIINLISCDDFVPQVALQKWGYSRYGQNWEFNPSPDNRDAMKAYFTENLSNGYGGFTTEQMLDLIDAFSAVAPTSQEYYSKKYAYTTEHGRFSRAHSGGAVTFSTANVYPYEYCQRGFSLLLTDSKADGLVRTLDWSPVSKELSNLTSRLVVDGGVTKRIIHAHQMIAYISWLQAGINIVEENISSSGS